MLINEEDKIQYNLIEDININCVIGRVDNLIEWLTDMLEYNDITNEYKDKISQTIKDLKEESKRCYGDSSILAIFKNEIFDEFVVENLFFKVYDAKSGIYR